MLKSGNTILDVGDTLPVWRLEQGAAPEFPPLGQDILADVAIIGGGLTGLSCALHLAQAGARVALLEAGPIAWGASGRNGGQFCTGFAPGQHGLERALGRETAQSLFDLAESGKRLIRDLQAQHGFDCHMREGYLITAATPRHRRALEEELAELEDYGYTGCRLISHEELADEWLGTDIYHGALFDPGAGQLDPAALCDGMARAAIAAGARIHAHSPAVGLEVERHASVLTLNGVAVRAHQVVLAANGANGLFCPPLAPYTLPVRACLIATEPLPQGLSRRLLRRAAAAVSTQLPPDYFGLTESNRLYFGAGASYLDRLPLAFAAHLHHRLRRVFPQLANQPDPPALEAAWCGTIAVTANRYPHCGRTGRHGNIWFAQGYSGQGVVLATLIGKLMAEAIAGDTERFDLFAAIPHRPHPGGPVRKWLHALRMGLRRLAGATD